MEYATRHLYFSFTFNPMPKSSENLRKSLEELGNLRKFPKTSETLETRF